MGHIDYYAFLSFMLVYTYKAVCTTYTPLHIAPDTALRYRVITHTAIRQEEMAKWSLLVPLLFAFYVPTIYKVISGQVLTCGGEQSWRFYNGVLLEGMVTGVTKYNSPYNIF